MNQTELDKLRSKLSGLHFAKEMLSDGEAEILYYAEQLLAEVDRLGDMWLGRPMKPETEYFDFNGTNGWHHEYHESFGVSREKRVRYVTEWYYE